MLRPVRLGLLPVLLLLAAGCASADGPEPRVDRPRAICLDEAPRSPTPRPDASMRPLFFLFCIQTP